MYADILHDAALAVLAIKLFPLFDFAHYLLACASVREDLGATAKEFSRKHPFACWFSCMFACFAGGVLANFLLGEPVVAIFNNFPDVCLASVAWFAIFHSPFDFIYKICDFLPLRSTLWVMKEVVRSRKVYDGVVHAQHVFPAEQAVLVWIIIGAAKGAGGGIVRFVERFVHGNWSEAALRGQHELLRPTFTTKACLLAATVFAFERSQYGVLAHATFGGVPRAVLFLGITLCLVYFRLAAELFGVEDPLVPLENWFCSVFLGRASSTTTANSKVLPVDADVRPNKPPPQGNISVARPLSHSNVADKLKARRLRPPADAASLTRTKNE